MTRATAGAENDGRTRRARSIFKVLSLAQNEVFSAHAFLETTECSSLRMSGTDLSRRIRSLSTTRRTYPERFVFRAGDGVAALERSIGRELATLGDIGLPEAARAGALCRLLPLETASGRPRTFPFFSSSSDFGGFYLGRMPADSARSWTVDHRCTSSRDLDTRVARIDAYDVVLK